MREEILEKYVSQTSFVLQRYKLEEIVRSVPKQQALSLVRHCYECNYVESEKILALILKGGD